MIKKILSGACAGICICMGGAVFLSCDNRYVGAVLFCVALICICVKGYSLFTGKIGYIYSQHDKEAVSSLLLGLLGNAIATIIGGIILSAAISKIGETARTICDSKLTQSVLSCFVRACGCGILMYLAVSVFREKNSPIGILFCIPVFILSGFEHSIADMFYFAASGIVSIKAFGYLCVVILGNSIGALILPVMQGK